MTTFVWSCAAGASWLRCWRRCGLSRTGYTLRKLLAEQGLNVDEGTLYPLLRRLETQGLLLSEWREEAKRNKRFYHLSDEGMEILTQLLAEWRNIDGSLNAILSESDHGHARPLPASR